MIVSVKHPEIDADSLNTYSDEFMHFIKFPLRHIKLYKIIGPIGVKDILLKEMSGYLALTDEEIEYVNANTDLIRKDYRDNKKSSKKFVLEDWNSNEKTALNFTEYFTEVFKDLIEGVRKKVRVGHMLPGEALRLTVERLQRIKKRRMEDESKGFPLNGDRIDYLLYYFQEEAKTFKKCNKEQDKQLSWVGEDAQLTLLYEKLLDENCKMIECSQTVFCGVFGKEAFTGPIIWQKEMKHLMWFVLALKRKVAGKSLLHIPKPIR